MHVDERIARLASRQHGLITTAQLTRLGLRRGAIRHRRDRGWLRRVHIGVFAVGHDALTEEAQLLAAVMACGPDAALSHEHAAYLWGMLPPWADIELSTIHVSVPSSSGRGRRPGISVHRAALSGDERMLHCDIPVTTPARTLIDLAARRDLRSLERAVDQAITEGIVMVSELRDASSRRGPRRGAATVRRLLDAAERYDSVTRSQLEEAFLTLIRGARLPEPALNVPIEGFRVDAAWRRERVAVELDGYRWHRTRGRMESDRARETRLRRAGWAPLRYSARQVFDEPLLVVADVTAVLAERRSKVRD